MSQLAFNHYIDHAVLKPEMTADEAAQHISIGIEFAVRTVCVRPVDILLAQRLCAASGTAVCTVLAFPHGVSLTASKVDECRRYIDLGVAEIDMVANYSRIRSGAWGDVEADIAAVAAVARAASVPLKVIVESAVLADHEIARATTVVADAGADFIKTSTGFSSGGATEAAVQTMLDAAKGRIAVKASGGIRDRATAQRYIDMGVARLGVGSTTTPVLCGDDSVVGDGGSY